MSSKDLATGLAASGLIGAGTLGAILYGVGPKGRARMSREVHDPRLYSNLRGSLHESADERISAHKKLKRGKHTVLSAMQEGFTRGSHREKNAAFFEELGKLGAVSDEEAEGSLQQLDKLEANKLTPGQVGRYAGIGAVAAPTVNVLKNAIKGGEQGLITGTGFKGKLRHMAADAVGGALLTGTVPLIRHQADQRAEVKQLRTYLSERGVNPEKTANMDPPVANALVDEFTKIALPRYEQEIQAGNILRSDVVPGAPDIRGGLLGPVAKRITRDSLTAPADVAPEALARKRMLNEHLYNAQVAKPFEATGVRMNADKNVMPGMVAGTRGGFFGPEVHAPPQSGQYLRSMGGSTVDRLKGTVGALSPQHLDKMIPAPIAADATLNKAVIQHEMGEASEMYKPQWRPFASHLGPEPIIRENLALQGDPEATQHMQRLRAAHPDDVLVQKAIRHAGGTPNSPIPLGGRQHRAVEGYIDSHTHQLDRNIMGQRLLTAAQSGKEIGYAPPAINAAARDAAGTLKDIVSSKPGLMGRLRQAKSLISSGRVMNQLGKR